MGVSRQMGEMAYCGFKRLVRRDEEVDGIVRRGGQRRVKSDFFGLSEDSTLRYIHTPTVLCTG